MFLSSQTQILPQKVSLPLGVTYILSLPLVLQGEVVHVFTDSSQHRFHLVALRLPVLRLLDKCVVHWRPSVHWSWAMPVVHSCLSRQDRCSFCHIGAIIHLIPCIFCKDEFKLELSTWCQLSFGTVYRCMESFMWYITKLKLVWKLAICGPDFTLSYVVPKFKSSCKSWWFISTKHLF